jgi:hypothetical protein
MIFFSGDRRSTIGACRLRENQNRLSGFGEGNDHAQSPIRSANLDDIRLAAVLANMVWLFIAAVID